MKNFFDEKIKMNERFSPGIILIGTCHFDVLFKEKYNFVRIQYLIKLFSFNLIQRALYGAKDEPNKFFVK